MKFISLNGTEVDYIFEINLRTLFTSNLSELPNFPNEFIIYCIRNNINGKVYIGQAVDFYGRFIGNESWSHLGRFRELMIDHYTHNKLYNAIKKYGSRNFTVYTLEELNSKSELSNREIYWIKLLQSCVLDGDYGYNMNYGGDNCSHLHTPEMLELSTSKAHETNLKIGNGDCMWMCHTEEANKNRMDSDKRNHGGVLAIHTKESRAKARKTIADMYEGDCAGPCHTEESIRLSKISRIINFIEWYLDTLHNDGAPNPVTWDVYWNWSDGYVYGSHMFRHMRTALDYLDNLRTSDRWTEEMENIYSYAAKNRDKYNI